MHSIHLLLFRLGRFGCFGEGIGQTPEITNLASPPELPLRAFFPKPQLMVPETKLSRARFPVVDVHTHFYFRLKHNPEALKDFVALMDRNQIAICVSMDAKLGSELEDHVNYLWTEYRDRFVLFAHIDFQGKGNADQPETWACNQPGFVHETILGLRHAKSRGLSGLKIFKDFGLQYRDAQGSLLKIDDPRFDPIWSTCGELGLPILIHTADPKAFFEPITPENERYEELQRRPQWSFADPKFPRRDVLLEARNRVIERHPQTTFIGAHVANNSEDLKTVGIWLDRYPNLYVDFASRINELGRQPYSAREFLIKYADRVLFGTDGPWPETRIQYYWRFLESRDEYFPYAEQPFPPQGFWRIYGVYLPDDVLKKIYHENAAKVIPGIAERLKP